jgi:hypothetical protein
VAGALRDAASAWPRWAARNDTVLSSHAKLRSEVVPKVEDKGPKQLALFEHDRTVLAPEPPK